MPRLSKCKDCGKELVKEDKYKYSNKTYCRGCYDKHIYENQMYNQLISNICKYFDIDKPTGLILKQIKEYKDKFDYTYSGIEYSLWYITQILNKSLELKYGIALVKYEYENAKEYFTKQQNIKKSIENNEIKIKDVVKTIKIKKKNKFKNFSINIDNL